MFIIFTGNFLCYETSDSKPFTMKKGLMLELNRIWKNARFTIFPILQNYSLLTQKQSIHPDTTPDTPKWPIFLQAHFKFALSFGVGFLQIYTSSIDLTFERKLHRLKLEFIQIRRRIRIRRWISHRNRICQVFQQPIFISLSLHNWCNRDLY